MEITIKFNVDGRKFNKKKVQELLKSPENCINVFDNCIKCPFTKEFSGGGVGDCIFPFNNTSVDKKFKKVKATTK